MLVSVLYDAIMLRARIADERTLSRASRLTMETILSAQVMFYCASQRLFSHQWDLHGSDYVQKRG